MVPHARSRLFWRSQIGGWLNAKRFGSVPPVAELRARGCKKYFFRNVRWTRAGIGANAHHGIGPTPDSSLGLIAERNQFVGPVENSVGTPVSKPPASQPSRGDHRTLQPTSQMKTEEIVKTEEIAYRLVTLCRKGEWETAQKELFADDAVSIEPEETPDFPKETKGLPALIEKGHKFSSMVEKTYSVKISDPLVAGDSFACAMSMDTKMKGRDRMTMTELCVYEVKDGKISSEQFHM